MPHALSMPSPGFQVVILCGPGVSFDTFTSNPEESPKALIPIANRPMSIQICYKFVTSSPLQGGKLSRYTLASSISHMDITLVTPPASEPAIAEALSINPYLTTLPLPRPNLIAPKDLDQTTGTAQIFRLSEVRSIITGDFIVLPCDILCEIGGETLLETWMIKEAGFGGATGGGEEFKGPKMSLGGERGGRRGGLGVWYSTKGGVKGEETDFIATSQLSSGAVPSPEGSLLPNTSDLVYSIPTDTLNDLTEEKKSLPLRHALLRHHPRLRMLSSHRDAHIYILPAWVIELIQHNEQMDNFSEDVIGWWAKAGWQEGLSDKLGLREIFQGPVTTLGEDTNGGIDDAEESNINVAKLNTTSSSVCSFGYRMGFDQDVAAVSEPSRGDSQLIVPPILAYVHPSSAAAPIIRRVDTSSLLLLMSLQLARLDSVDQVGRELSSPFAHINKVAPTANIAAKCTVTRADCLIAENVSVEERSAIKECVIGSNCQIKQGAKLTRCVLMDGVVVGKGCKLTGCILGRRAEIGPDSILQDCEVEDNMRIEPETESKGEKFKSSEGLEASEEEMKDAFESHLDDGMATLNKAFELS